MDSTLYASAPVNGATTPSEAEDEELYSQLLQLRDVVISGKHASLKLSHSAIERLKTALIVSDAQARDSQQSLLGSAFNGTAFATNRAQPQQSTSYPDFVGLPGLHSSPSSPPYTNGATESLGAQRLAAAGLDPIFLEKSESLVRAEGKLKRQRLNRDLEAQVEQRKHSSRDRDPGVEAPSPIDIDYVLLAALERVKPISGLKETEKSRDSSSFDENDYYSSQVQSDWSSEANSSKASDKAAGAFTADFERLDGGPSAPTSFAQRSSRRKEPSIPGASSLQQGSRDRPHVYTDVPEDIYEVGDDDDEYSPPEPTAFDSFREDAPGMDIGQITPPDDDNSEYEPGEITDSNIPTPQHQAPQPIQQSPRVPVIRNHLTHIVAPQPNRVSPLATAKGPSYELELVNGRPEVVQKPQNHQNNFPSRASTASPSGNGAGGSHKKRKNKKRKRDAEPAGRAKRRREKQTRPEPHQSSAYEEPYIKDEPISPPPFANLPDVPPYGQIHAQRRPIDIDLSSSGYPPQAQYVNEYPRSGLRYEMQPTSPTYVRVASPTTQRPMQRDTQDLRRVASLHVAQRLPSPHQRVYSPIPQYRTASVTYGDAHQAQLPPSPGDSLPSRHQERPELETNHYVRDERSRSPPRVQEYRESSYAHRAQSPTMMPPPPGPARKIIVDQNGNRYYAAEAVPASASMPVSRASAAPFDRRSQLDVPYERASVHPTTSYTQLPATQSGHYSFSDGRMAPPLAPPARRQAAPEQRIAYADSNAFYPQDYNTREPSTRYTEAPTSPIYQQIRGSYEQMPPPPPVSQHPQAEPTSPVYISSNSRSYSVRPEEPPQQQQVLRHASVAPVQYVRRDVAASAPVRAVSVMPSSSSSADYGALASSVQQQQQRTYSQAPPPQQAIRYVDQHGNEVFPSEVRPLSTYRY